MTAAGPDETLTMAPPPDAPLRIKRPRLAGLIIGGVALAGLIAFVLHVGDIADFAQRAAEADWRWLALGVVAQAFAFLAQALVFALALARRGNRVRRLSLFSLSIGKLFAEAIENAPPGPATALRAQGNGNARIFLYATLPQVLPQLMSYTLYRWENNIRAAAVLGVVGAGGLGQMLAFHMGLFQMHKTATVLLAMLALGALVDVASFAWRRALTR